jgi:hypothetical protein
MMSKYSHAHSYHNIYMYGCMYIHVHVQVHVVYTENVLHAMYMYT